MMGDQGRIRAMWSCRDDIKRCARPDLLSAEAYDFIDQDARYAK